MLRGSAPPWDPHHPVTPNSRAQHVVHEEKPVKSPKRFSSGPGRSRTVPEAEHGCSGRDSCLLGREGGAGAGMQSPGAGALSRFQGGCSWTLEESGVV